MTNQEFDWTADESVAVQEQPAIAVYPNPVGQVVIRRQRSWDEEDDSFVHISRGNVLTIVGAILAAAGMDDIRLYRQHGMSCEDIGLGETQTRSLSKDRTGAERQRRYRNRHRNGSDRDVTDETVTSPAQPLLIAAE
jgi:hypothetical protein